MLTPNLDRTFRSLGIRVCLAAVALSGLCGAGAGILYNGTLLAVDHYRSPAPVETEEADVSSEDSGTPVVSPPPEVVLAPTAKYAVLAGVVFGAGSGLGAGLLWVRTMRRRTLRAVAKRNRIPPGLIGAGLVMGLLVGVAASTLLHVALALFTLQMDLLFQAVLAGPLYGVPTGAGLGLLCGLGWWLACGDAFGLASSEAVTEDTAP